MSVTQFPVIKGMTNEQIAEAKNQLHFDSLRRKIRRLVSQEVFMVVGRMIDNVDGGQLAQISSVQSRTLVAREILREALLQASVAEPDNSARDKFTDLFSKLQDQEIF